MRWRELKAELLSAGTVRLAGEPAGEYIARSAAGPGAGGTGSVFFSLGGKRVRLSVDGESPLTLTHRGGGRAFLEIGGRKIEGILEEVALHCPRQAYVTVSTGCIFSCRYCGVPGGKAGRKSPGEIVEMVRKVAGRIDAISLTSGVVGSVEEEERYVLRVVGELRRHFSLPIGVSIYPSEGTAERLSALGVREVKFNVETATDSLFAEMCPGLSRDAIWDALRRSVPLFGRNHVFSNLIVGLGETDEEAARCIRRLAGMGVIPIVRPLTPAGACRHLPRPSAERLLALFEVHAEALRESGLDPRGALSMCAACTGCDLVPGRDDA
ncbi:MAG: radical SAM protein [Methanolinea sp.]|nr:radical SAM protein [Methanolinea sp.]